MGLLYTKTCSYCQQGLFVETARHLEDRRLVAYLGEHSQRLGIVSATSRQSRVGLELIARYDK